jgi:hypothetical protein
VRIADIRVIDEPGTSRLVADVTTARWPRPFPVWFEVPRSDHGPTAGDQADPWLAALLLPAMRTGEPLEIDGVVSPELFAALGELQAVYAAWLPSAQPIEVHPDALHAPKPATATSDTGLFFSCGIDSWYSLLQSEHRRARGRPAVTHLVVVHGVDVDIGPWKADVAQAMFDNARRVAAHFDLTAVPVVTNVRRFYTRSALSWHWAQAGALAAVGLALRDLCATFVVSSGPGYSANVIDPALEAGGCHPLLVPLFSTVDSDFTVSAGAASRLQRVAAVAQSNLALDVLRVCRANAEPSYNCGRCGKCVATMLDLAAVGALDRCRTLPGRLDPDTVARVRTIFPYEAAALRLRQARLADRGAAPEVLTALQRTIDRAERDRAALVRATDTVCATVRADQCLVLLDEDQIRYEVARTHRHVLSFTERDGFDHGLPIDDDAAVAELERLRLMGAERLVVWKHSFWVLERYPAFGRHVRRSPALAETPEVLVFDLAARTAGAP